MFRNTTRKTTLGSALSMLEVIFHASVRNVRKTNGNGVLGLRLSIFQTALLVAVFYLMFQFLGMRGSAIRGDLMLYLMSGVCLSMLAEAWVCNRKSSSSAMGRRMPPERSRLRESGADGCETVPDLSPWRRF